ncbi:ribonuclease P protein component [Arthrobacter roseus]|uniref:ribonuclease P protein component n=1 Tax=Arthrobacter roseus TaxID=136274 RepID=UPI00196264C8
MLAKRRRIRTSADFSNAVRSGSRYGRRNVVVYAAARESAEPSRFGFIVSKAVGNAVARNVVKRRLRECAALSLANVANGVDVVVRALPPAAEAEWTEIEADFNSALSKVVSRLEERKVP